MVAGASCQTWWCYEQSRQADEKRLDEWRTEALANPHASDKWGYVYGSLERAAERRRSSAAFRAQFDWSPQTVLDRWPELERRLAGERQAWMALWHEVDPTSAGALCIAARSNPDAKAAFEMLLEAQRQRPGDRQLISCLVEKASAAGRGTAALEAAQKLVELRGDESESWYVLINAAKAAGADAIAIAARVERADRFPDEPWMRADVLRALRDAHADAELERLFERYVAEAETPSEIEPLCGVFASESAQAESCYRSVLAVDREGERSRGDSDAVSAARAVFLRRAIGSSDPAEVERLILARVPSDGVGDWSRALNVKAALCPAFMRDLGRMVGAVGAEPTGWPFRSLVWSLESCGEREAAQALLDSASVGNRSQSIRERVALLDRRGAEERLAASPTDVMAQGDVERASVALPPAERIAYITARLEAAPDRLWLRQHLLAGYRELADAGHPDDALASANHSLAVLPSDLDWSLQVAFFDFKWKNDGAARAIAQDVLRTKTATTRQRDEAEFLLARLERRAGRYAEASERLERYFLDRVRYSVCAGCDVAMGLDLLAALDRERLTSYLARRAEAVEYFRNVVAQPAGIGYGRPFQRPWPEATWTDKLVAAPACRQEETLARLRAEKPWSRPMKVSEAAKLPVCPSSWGDVERALDGAAPESIWQSLTRID